MILDLRRQGLSVSEIARHTGFDRKTVRRYIDRGLEPPAYGPRKPRPTLLDPFTGYLRERVKAYGGRAVHRKRLTFGVALAGGPTFIPGKFGEGFKCAGARTVHRTQQHARGKPPVVVSGQRVTCSACGGRGKVRAPAQSRF